jgi:hypothetical protein
MAMSELDWASGLFEGEGWFSLVSNGANLRGVAGLKMADEDSVHRFHRAVTVGHVNGPYPRPNPKHKPMWIWTANSFETVQAVIAMLWNGLGIRRQRRAAEVLRIWGEQPYGRQTSVACVNGHPWTEETTSFRPRGDRRCRVCNRNAARRYYYGPNGYRAKKLAISMDDDQR